MNQISLEDIEPFSINNAYYRSGVRTAAYRSWAERVWNQLLLTRNEAAIKEFKGVDEPLMFLIVHTIPNLLTVKGKISRQSKDLTNIEKTIVDVLCESRYVGRKLRSGKIIDNLSLDDKNIVYLQSVKKKGERFRIDVFITRKDKYIKVIHKKINKILPLELQKIIFEYF